MRLDMYLEPRGSRERLNLSPGMLDENIKFAITEVSTVFPPFKSIQCLAVSEIWSLFTEGFQNTW
jgi:hypothetical protein